MSEKLPQRGVGLARIGLAQLALLEGDADGAGTEFRTALNEAAQVGSRFLACESLEGLAFVAAARGDGRSAVRLLTAVDGVHSSINQRRPPDNQSRVDATLLQLQEVLGEEEVNAARQVGHEMSLDDAIAYGRGVGTLADSKHVLPAALE